MLHEGYCLQGITNLNLPLPFAHGKIWGTPYGNAISYSLQRELPDPSPANTHYSCILNRQNLCKKGQSMFYFSRWLSEFLLGFISDFTLVWLPRSRNVLWLVPDKGQKTNPVGNLSHQTAENYDNLRRHQPSWLAVCKLLFIFLVLISNKMLASLSKAQGVPQTGQYWLSYQDFLPLPPLSHHLTPYYTS